MARLARRFDVEQRDDDEAYERGRRANPGDRDRRPVAYRHDDRHAPDAANQRRGELSADQPMTAGGVAPMDAAHDARRAQVGAVDRRGEIGRAHV